MYHEEKIINEVLCWRGTPDGDWQQYTAKALTIALTVERGRIRDLSEKIGDLSGKIAKVKTAIDN